MALIDWILVFICFITSFVSAFTDIKYKKVKNIVVLPAIAVSAVLNITNCIMYDKILVLLTNAGFMALFSIVMYALKFMGAGDSKLLMFIALSTPVGFYENRFGGNFSVIVVLAYIFAVCFIYILAESIVMLIRSDKSDNNSKKYNIKSILTSYLWGFMIITLINELLFLCVQDFYIANHYVITLVNFVIVSVIPKTGICKYNMVLAFGSLTCITIAIITSYGQRFVSADHRILLMLVAVISIRIFFMDRYNYLKINTCDIKSGMILSAQTAEMIEKVSNGKIHISKTEDMNSKLTAEQAENIKELGVTTQSIDNVIVVRCLPLGFFISTGTIAFLIENVVRTLCD